MTLPILQAPSPNFDTRKGGQQPRYIILHYTGMPDAASARQRLCDPTSKVSAHYLIEREGRAWQLVAEESRAWHAGVGAWQGETDLNSAAIGIELVNRGHQWGYQAFPEPQIATLLALLKDIRQRHAIPAGNILGHSDVAPQRKEDPGEFFPWPRLAKDGFGLWPMTPVAASGCPMDYRDARAMLRAIGYDCAADGEYDLPLRRILLAFQRHWLPRHLSGLADAPTAAMLRAVAGDYAAARGGKA